MMKRRLPRRDNPWELLIFALVVFAAGVLMLLQDGPMIAIGSGTGRTKIGQPVQALSPNAAHVFGAFAVGAAALLVLLYFRTRRASVRDRTRVVEHGRE